MLYLFAGKVVCQRTIVGSTPTVAYLHGDLLGSTGATTSSAGAVTATQRYAPFGAVRAGGGLPTTVGFTGQRQDGTGLLFYNARYYDPVIGRFISADSLVPGAASGAGGAAASLGPDSRVALRPLAVDFRERPFSDGLAAENRFTLEKGFAFQLADEDRRAAKDGAGPQNPQALNRYAYVLNNPVRYTDPTGHIFCVCILWSSLTAVWNSFWGDILGSIRELAGWLQLQYVQWLFDNGYVALSFAGADGVERTISSRVKEQPGLHRQARRINQQASDDINNLLEQFLNGNTNPGLGNKYLSGTDIFYLRGANGGRVFLRKVGENAYEILGYADKSNEERVIELLLQIYGR